MIGVRVAHSYAVADIAAMHALCVEAGVRVYPLAQASNVALFGGDQGYYLEVVAEDAAAARALLADSAHAERVIDE